MHLRMLLAICRLLSLTVGGEIGQAKPASTTNSPVSIATRSSVASSSSIIASGSGRACQNVHTGCCGPITISTVSQLQSLSGCATFYGDVTLTSVAVPTPTALSTGDQPSIGIPLTEIQGSLQMDNVYLESNWPGSFDVSMDSLETVSNVISLRNIHAMQVPRFPSLARVQSIVFENISFAASQPDRASSAEQLVWNTAANAQSLQSIHGITFSNTSINTIGPFSTAEAGPLNLLVGGNSALTILNLSTSSAFEKMIISDNLLTNFDLGSLTVVSSVILTGNSELKSLELPSLVSIGQMSVSDNSKLTSIDVQDLDIIRFALYLNGHFDNVNLQPHLNVVGTIAIKSSGSLQCDKFKHVRADGKEPLCTALTHTISGISATPASTSQHSLFSISPSGAHRSSDHSGLPSGVKIGLGVGIGLGGALILALLLFFRWRSRRRNSYSIRSIPKQQAEYGGEGDSYVYRKNPEDASIAINTKQARREQQSEEHAPFRSQGMGDEWIPPEPAVATTARRMELEEQQGERHEMDARSIDLDDDDDNDDDNDEEAETRSLEDIERLHRQR